MKICLIRHGETDWNATRRLQGRSDIPINQNGLRQAQAVADYLAKNKNDWHAVISSPLSRAQDTAKIIALALEHDQVHTEPQFIERDYGRASGLTPDERRLRYPDGRFDGMESIEALRARIYSALVMTIRKFEGQNIVIVSHGGAINSLLASLSGDKIGTGKTRLAPSCMNLLEAEMGKVRIIYHNKMAHEMDAAQDLI